jgi:hypothetical protein
MDLLIYVSTLFTYWIHCWVGAEFHLPPDSPAGLRHLQLQLQERAEDRVQEADPDEI